MIEQITKIKQNTGQSYVQKHVLAVHDISCVGRCSLTIALPVISAAGIITSVMPTAVLSTHTGGFAGYTYRDLTSDMLSVADHWSSLSVSFDAIYTGYLGSKEQLEIVAELIRRFGRKNSQRSEATFNDETLSDETFNDDPTVTLIIIDPVMADHGRLYAGFSPDFPQGMKELCKSADVITPNMTEALLMLNEPYQEGPYDKGYIKSILEALASDTAKETTGNNRRSVTNNKRSKKIVLTGVYLKDCNENKLGAVAYDNGDMHFSMAERVPGHYHGTGDLFASVLTAHLVKGKTLSQAADAAVRFTHRSIERTYLAGTDIKYGVNFEEGLGELFSHTS